MLRLAAVLASALVLASGCAANGAMFPSGGKPASSQSAGIEQIRMRLPGTIRVGPDGDVRTVAEASRLAKDGDTVEVQAGEYRGDVTVWLQRNLRIRAVGGRAVVIADGRSAEGKGIWVIRNGDIEIEGFDFIGSRVPSLNGAGIRFERGNLMIRNSRFFDNENGVLTGNDQTSTLIVDRCEFTRNGHPNGQSHGLYVGQIARLDVRASYFSRARGGHLLKTRARKNEILYNRITDEDGGLASYELEFPNGGEARVIGNLIEQAPSTQNATVVSYGAEGYPWERNRLLLAHNTIVNRRDSGGVFLKVYKGHASLSSVNNLYVGRGDFQISGDAVRSGDMRPTLRDFVNSGRYDYRLKTEYLRDHWHAPTGLTANASTIVLDRTYVHPRKTVSVDTQRVPVPGAFPPASYEW